MLKKKMEMSQDRSVLRLLFWPNGRGDIYSVHNSYNFMIA